MTGFIAVAVALAGLLSTFVLAFSARRLPWQPSGWLRTGADLAVLAGELYALFCVAAVTIVLIERVGS